MRLSGSTVLSKDQKNEVDNDGAIRRFTSLSLYNASRRDCGFCNLRLTKEPKVEYEKVTKIAAGSALAFHNASMQQKPSKKK